MTLSDRDALLRPLVSLIAKSEKALLKLSPGGWQHTTLSQNLNALKIALHLLDGEAQTESVLDRDEYLAAQYAFAQMIGKTEHALSKFAAGTSQHSLLQNRLKALQVGEDLVRAMLPEGLKDPPKEPSAEADGSRPNLE